MKFWTCYNIFFISRFIDIIKDFTRLIIQGLFLVKKLIKKLELFSLFILLYNDKLRICFLFTKETFIF